MNTKKHPKYFNLEDLLGEFYELMCIGCTDFAISVFRSTFISNYLQSEYFDKKQFYNFIGIWLAIHHAEIRLGSIFPSHKSQADEEYPKLERSIRLYRYINLVQLSKDHLKNPHILYIIAQYYALNGLVWKALDYYQLAANKYKGELSPNFYCHWANALYRIHDFDEGDKKFKIAERKACNKWWLYDNWAECKSIYSFPNDSYSMDIKALMLKPNSENYYYRAGYRIVLNNNPFIKKLKKLSVEALNCNIDKVNLYKTIGIQLFQAYKFEKAYLLFNIVIKMKKGSYELHSWHARCLFSIFKYDEAEKEFNYAAMLDIHEELDYYHYYYWHKAKNILGNFKDADILSKDYRYKNAIKIMKNDDAIFIANYIFYNEGAMVAINHLKNALIKTPIEHHFKRITLMEEIGEYYRGLGRTSKVNAIQEKISQENKLFLNKSFDLTGKENKTKYRSELIEIKLQTKLKFPILEEIFKIIPIVNNDSEINKKFILILTPKYSQTKKSPHINEISWYNQNGNESQRGDVKNNPFDFLYGIASLHKKGTRIKIGEGLSNEQKSEIFPKYKDYKRFYSKALTGDEAQMPKMKSEINKYFNFDFIIQEGIYYTINKDITVELNPYPT